MRRWLPASAAQRGIVLLVTALCTFLVAATAATSLWLRTSADDIAEQVFGDANAEATQLQVSYDGVRDLAAVPVDGGGQVDAALPDLMRDHFAAPRSAVLTPVMIPETLPARAGEPTFLSVASLPGVAGQVEVLRGRLPDPGTNGTVPRDRLATWTEAPRRPKVVEVALQETASREMELPLGSWVRLSPLSYSNRSGGSPPVLHVVGLFRATDPAPSALDDLDTLRQPAISDLPEQNLVRATALAADEETVLAARWTGPPSVRFTFDPVGSPTAAEVQQLEREGRQVALQDWPAVVPADGIDPATGVSALAQTVTEQRRASDGLVTLTLTTLGAGALTVLLAASLVLASRRAAVTTVVRARGASGPWLVLRRGGEAGLLVLPGLLTAAFVGWLVSGGPPAPTDVAAALVAAAACVVVVTAAQTVPRGATTGSQVPAVLGDALQLVAVALAVTVTLLVLVGGALAADDPLLLALPPLLGAAAAVVVVRGLQLLLGGLRRAVRRTRPAAPVVALSQAGAVARRVVVASTALVLAVSSVVLASAATDTLRRGAERAGWEQVGADLAVAANGLRPAAVERLAAVDGVRRVAAVFTANSVSVDTRTGVEGVTVVGVDAAAMGAVGAGFGGSLRGLDLSPRADGSLPAVASSDLVLDDERAEVLYAQSRVAVSVVDRMEQVPGVTDGGSFVLVDLAAFEEATERELQLFTTVLVSGDPDPSAVRAAVQEIDPQASVTTRSRVTDQLLRRPAVSRTVATLAVAGIAAAALAVFGILLTVGLGAPERRRTTLVLAAVGARRRQAARIGVLALLPIVLAGSLAAAACGVLLTLVAGGGFDLAGLTGTRQPLAVRPDPSTVAALAGGLLALVAIAGTAVRAGRPVRSTDRPEPEAR